MVVILLPAIVLASDAPGTIQYTGPTTVGTDHAAFNVFYDVPSQGNEADFVRVAPSGVTTWTNSVEACDGDLVDLNIYIHNGAQPSANDPANTGPGVAVGSNLAISIPGGESDEHTVSATASADNVSAISDSAKITCNGHDVELEIVPGTAEIFSQNRGVESLSDDVFTNAGTPIGSYADNGVVPGCWEYRVWVKATVRVVETEIPEDPVYECNGVVITKLGDRKIKAVVNTTAEPANLVTITGYHYDFGDGNDENSASNTAMHTYAGDGNYTTTVTVTFDVEIDGQVVEKESTCSTRVSFDSEVCEFNSQLPKGHPDCELPNTGPVSFIAALFGTGTLGTAIRGWMRSRKDLLSIG